MKKKIADNQREIQANESTKKMMMTIKDYEESVIQDEFRVFSSLTTEEKKHCSLQLGFKVYQDLKTLQDLKFG